MSRKPLLLALVLALLGVPVVQALCGAGGGRCPMMVAAEPSPAAHPPCHGAPSPQQPESPAEMGCCASRPGVTGQQAEVPVPLLPVGAVVEEPSLAALDGVLPVAAPWQSLPPPDLLCLHSTWLI